MASFEFESFTPSGLTIEGPWFTLHYGHSTDQAPCVVLHAHEMFRNHSSLSNGVDGIAEFLEQPKNPRVAPSRTERMARFCTPVKVKRWMNGCDSMVLTPLAHPRRLSSCVNWSQSWTKPA